MMGCTKEFCCMAPTTTPITTTGNPCAPVVKFDKALDKGNAKLHQYSSPSKSNPRPVNGLDKFMFASAFAVAMLSIGAVIAVVKASRKKRQSRTVDVKDREGFRQLPTIGDPEMLVADETGLEDELLLE